jgi:hypothetical protein
MYKCIILHGIHTQAYIYIYIHIYVNEHSTTPAWVCHEIMQPIKIWSSHYHFLSRMRKVNKSRQKQRPHIENPRDNMCAFYMFMQVQVCLPSVLSISDGMKKHGVRRFAMSSQRMKIRCNCGRRGDEVREETKSTEVVAMTGIIVAP